MKILKGKMVFTEDVLGSWPNNEQIVHDYIYKIFVSP